MTHEDMVGSVFHFVYSDETYRIEVLSLEKLRWTRIEGEDVGQCDEESYTFSELAGGLTMLSWVEADMLGLSNVLDFTAGTVITHAKVGRDVHENPGKLREASP